MYDSENEVTVHRVIVIDDNPEIHGDFKSIFQEDVIDTCDVDEMEASIFKDAHFRHEIDKDRYELDYAFQGEEGVKKVKQAVLEGRPYELAFVDMRMPPGWDGLETIEHIWEIDPCVQVIICSAYSDYTWEEVISRLGHKGSLLILEKPFNSREISQLACALTEKYILSRKVNSGFRDLDEIIKQKSHKLEIARINAEEAEKILNDIITGEDLPEEIKNRIHNIRENSSKLLSAINSIFGIPSQPEKASFNKPGSKSEK